MRNLSRALLYAILLLSIIVGSFPFLANSITYYVLYSLLFLFNLVFLIYNYKNKNIIKIDYSFFVVAIIMIVGLLVRPTNKVLYAIAFLNILISYYSLSCTQIDMRKLSRIISIILIPTIVFNGFLNTEIISGTAFSGRLNPFMYFPYIVLALKDSRKNSFTYWFLLFECLLIFIDLIWSGSRISVASLLFMILFIISIRIRNGDRIKFDRLFRKKLRIILFILLLFQAVYPIVYVNLYKTYNYELNQYSMETTSKNFFSGRQTIWMDMNRILYNKNTYFFGTRDVNYELVKQSPHNEFMGIYYYWGILVSIATYFYLYRVGSKCVKNIQDKNDIIVFAAFLATIMCTSSETFLYVPYFFIFEKLLVSNLLNKENYDKEK